MDIPTMTDQQRPPYLYKPGATVYLEGGDLDIAAFAFTPPTRRIRKDTEAHLAVWADHYRYANGLSSDTTLTLGGALTIRLYRRHPLRRWKLRRRHNIAVPRT
jgi:hypothetical protein